ncbi:hypothetical protein POVCU2_0026510 [Plasmodium ovale curtisi]|uniref:Uncharacterized protein n=1 Tax=Plasmodium ovale curtisi TaxID=864141 RepID=A0A1A8W039_PLAOA|nr:hypothetical protein POVCU2_0026510 [Plasmodium ovale curtisi]SBS92848.1 hypothetical protein POVCU1_024130 [Plasmodium ovale curtisi]
MVVDKEKIKRQERRKAKNVIPILLKGILQLLVNGNKKQTKIATKMATKMGVNRYGGIFINEAANRCSLKGAPHLRFLANVDPDIFRKVTNCGMNGSGKKESEKMLFLFFPDRTQMKGKTVKRLLVAKICIYIYETELDAMPFLSKAKQLFMDAIWLKQVHSRTYVVWIKPSQVGGGGGSGGVHFFSVFQIVKYICSQVTRSSFFSSWGAEYQGEVHGRRKWNH